MNGEELCAVPTHGRKRKGQGIYKRNMHAREEKRFQPPFVTTGSSGT
jgi:hypothetical protein